MPAVVAGRPYRDDLRRRLDRFSDPRGATFRDALLSALGEDGGDFQDARFSADTVLRVERRAREANGKGYRVHVWERELATLPDCEDLVHADTFASDFLGED
jgi:hypothetical protein